MTAAPGTTHPRFQARIADVLRSRSRGRTIAAIALLVVFILGGLGWLVVQSSILDVESVDVRGTRRARVADVHEAAAVRRGEALLLVDRGGVAARVEELPWVEDADVTLSLPDTLVVKVTERRAVAWVRVPAERSGTSRDRAPDAAHGAALVDATGRVLDVRARPPSALPELVFGGRVPDAGERIRGAAKGLAVVATMPRVLAPRVQRVEAGPGGFVMGADGIEVVRFGRATRLEEKWAALVAVVEKLGDDAVYLVDVRVPSTPAVARTKDVPPPDPPVSESPEPDGEGEGPPPAGDEGAATTEG